MENDLKIPIFKVEKDWIKYSNGKKVGWNTDEIKKLRSKTYPGIAKAMAEQWGKYIEKTNN